MAVGFWDWLAGKPKAVEVADDVIWMTSAAKLRGLCAAARGVVPAGPPLLVLAHFPATLASVREAIQGQGVPHRPVAGRLTPAEVLRQAAEGHGPLLALAESLLPGEPTDPPTGSSERLGVLVAERHFLRSHDDQVVAFAATLGRRARVTFHLALHDPLLRQFAGDWVGGVLGRLGMSEDDPIESRMVAGRVQGAQARFDRYGDSESRAASPEEWLRLNAPDLAT
jgi:preprotein translocase subunit SecA